MRLGRAGSVGDLPKKKVELAAHCSLTDLHEDVAVTRGFTSDLVEKPQSLVVGARPREDPRTDQISVCAAEM